MKISALKLGQHIHCIPIIHGRSIFAQEVRRAFLADRYQCVAVELPPSLGATVVEAVAHLPLITAVAYRESSGEHCYIPIEPGEGIIEALRLAAQERVVSEFVDMEMEACPAQAPLLPDEYAINHVGLEKYYHSVQRVLPVASPGDIQDLRECWMAGQLRQLDERFNKILFVCGLAHLQGIKRHFQAKSKLFPVNKPDYHPQILAVHSDSIFLLTGEIPYLTYLYEKSRYSLELHHFDKTEGIKELLLETRKEYCRDFPEEEERLSPGAIQALLIYLRNLCLMQQRLTPSMYDLVIAAQGVGGGGFGARLVEMAKFYPYQDPLAPLEPIRIGINHGWYQPFGEVPMKNRLPGPPFTLKDIRLERRPRIEKQKKWRRHWGRHSECSWPEEDDRIESFTRYVQRRALGVLGEDQARVEKFTSSIKDGLDLRETLRKWHTGEIYVKELPPVQGDVGAVIFIFDPEYSRYPWRSTWLAEHDNESTLCFYATDHLQDLVGPGISRAFYGGALFIFPPIVIPDIWTNQRFKTARTPIAKLVAAASYYSKAKYIAYVASARPDLELRALARREQCHLLYLPLSTFSTYTIRKLRKFHVLQHHQIRSYAQKYIR